MRCDPRGLPDLPPTWPTSNRLALSKKIFFCFFGFFLNLNLRVLCIFAPAYGCLQTPEEDVGFPGAEVIGSCELSSMAAGILAQVL